MERTAVIEFYTFMVASIFMAAWFSAAASATHMYKQEIYMVGSDPLWRFRCACVAESKGQKERKRLS